MAAPMTPRQIADLDVGLAELARDVARIDAYREGQLAEQRHAFLDLDPDSACRPAGFVCPNATPEVAA